MEKLTKNYEKFLVALKPDVVFFLTESGIWGKIFGKNRVGGEENV
ncbi:MAG: hypothetical protein ACYS9Y_14675 [Planctomycetota bacterium]